LAQYGGTLEATVEDLLAQKTVNTTEPLATSPTTQGFSGYPMLLEIAKLGEETLTIQNDKGDSVPYRAIKAFYKQKDRQLTVWLLPAAGCVSGQELYGAPPANSNQPGTY
jgi:hypothetical protein